MSGRSFHELIKITVATVITGVLHIVGITIFWGRMPASYYLIGIMLQFFLTVGVRLRLYLYRKCIGGVSCRGKAGSY